MLASSIIYFGLVLNHSAIIWIFPQFGRGFVITSTRTDDNRSYHINSDKIFSKLGYKPKRTLEDAANDLCSAFSSGKLPNSMTDDRYHNVRVMKNNNSN